MRCRTRLLLLCILPFATPAAGAEAAGFTVTAARWRGAQFLPDQTYVVLVGRKPEA